MKMLTTTTKLAAALFGVALLTTACSSTDMKNDGMKGDAMKSDAMMPMAPAAANLSGAQEVPPNPSSATGKSTIMVAADKSVSGEVSYWGMTATMAHIHEAAPGVNGGVVVPLTKSADDMFSVPAGAKLNDAQYASYMAGNLYVNVHSAAYPGGEIRVQLNPE